MAIISKDAAVVAAALLLCLPATSSFHPITSSQHATIQRASTTTTTTTTTALLASEGFGKPVGKGFGGSSGGDGGGGGCDKGTDGTSPSKKMAPEKTYGKTARAPVDVTIDLDGAMSDFFSTNEEFAPLFRSIATSATVPAMDFIGGGEHGAPIEFGANDPWKQLDAIPTGNKDALSVVESFLDEVQRSLTDIPVTESEEPDENDVHFIEEGRRMLRIGRFHVLQDVRAGCIDSHRELFATCWSEIAELRRADEVDTGSVIILPDHDLDDLRRFIDMNLQRPLEWLGIGDMFEVASLKRDSPAIRLLHKLSDIPTEPDQAEEE